MLQTKLIGVKIMLADQHWIGTIVPQIEGEKLVEDWASGMNHLKNLTKLTGRCYHTGMHWAVKLDAVVGMHTFTWDPDVVAQQQNQQRPTPAGMAVSGPAILNPYTRKVG